MSLKLLLPLAIFLSFTADARLLVKVNMIYKNGIDKNLVLESELHSTEEIWGKRRINIQMKNGARLDFRAGFWERPVAKLKEVGPSSQIFIEGRLFKPNGELAKQVERRQTQVSLGEPLVMEYTDKSQLLTVSITPYMEQ